MPNVKRVVAINLGSSSTKVAYYENDKCVLKSSIPHPAEEISQFATIWDQKEYRYKMLNDFLAANGIEADKLDAISTRGGHTVPITGGVWKINDEMLKESRSEKYGNHVSDLGLIIATEFGKAHNIPAFTVDTPCTNEFKEVAKFSGSPEISRASRFHVLNHRAVGRQFAKDHGLNYEDLRLVTVHMGGGTTVSATEYGKLVDATNGLDGEGPFSTNRTGGLPVGDLVNLCFSGKYTHKEMKKFLNGNGGMMAYTGENDVLTVQRRADEGDELCQKVLEAMWYQTAKEIGAYATVLNGKVDAILLTGGIANSEKVVSILTEKVGFIAPIYVYPGELEMQSLALQVYAALLGETPIKEL